jgi:glycosyltransferase involved in cell wall biosynthesis
VFDTTLNSLEAQYAEFKDSVIILRLGPIDQMLNALLSTAHVALQLSSSEGFEVKVSEALHKGLPVIVSGAGGIPLQVQHGNGFVVDSSDRASMVRAVAGHLDELFSNKDLYNRMSSCAKQNVSDEVSTVGNAVCWMYLANQLVRNPSFAYNGRWVWELARDQIGEWIRRDEPRLQHSGRC